MKFLEKENKYYYRYWESEDGEIGIGIEKMLFGRVRIQVLHKDLGSEYPQWVIEEYITYKGERVVALCVDIILKLEKIELQSGREWWKVFEALPPRTKKYLEDKEEDEVYVGRRERILEDIELIKSKNQNNGK